MSETTTPKRRKKSDTTRPIERAADDNQTAPTSAAEAPSGLVTVKVKSQPIGETQGTFFKGETFATTLPRAVALGRLVEVVELPESLQELYAKMVQERDAANAQPTGQEATTEV